MLTDIHPVEDCAHIHLTEPERMPEHMLRSDETEDDSQGEYLDGAKHFRLTLPADVPRKFLAGDFPSMQTIAVGTRCGCSTSTPSAGAVSALPAHRLLAAGPLVQFVGQVMSHLRSEVWSYTHGGDLEGARSCSIGRTSRPASSRTVIWCAPSRCTSCAPLLLPPFIPCGWTPGQRQQSEVPPPLH